MIGLEQTALVSLFPSPDCPQGRNRGFSVHDRARRIADLAEYCSLARLFNLQRATYNLATPCRYQRAPAAASYVLRSVYLRVLQTNARC